MHGGNMHYLTNCKKNAYNDVKLLYSVSLVYRAKKLILKYAYRKLLADHSISVYRKKLMVVAKRNNLNRLNGQ